MKIKKCVPASGFTLVEILLTLSVLSVIVTFAMGKLTSVCENHNRKNAFLEAFYILEQLEQERSLSPALASRQFLLAHVNEMKRCSDSVAEGCWPIGINTDFDKSSIRRGGVVLHNGAVIVGMPRSPLDTGAFVIGIDYNGPKPPNMMGRDEILVDTCVGKYPCQTNTLESHEEGVLVAVDNPPGWDLTDKINAGKLTGNKFLFQAIYGQRNK